MHPILSKLITCRRNLNISVQNALFCSSDEPNRCERLYLFHRRIRYNHKCLPHRHIVLTASSAQLRKFVEHSMNSCNRQPYESADSAAQSVGSGCVGVVGSNSALRRLITNSASIAVTRLSLLTSTNSTCFVFNAARNSQTDSIKGSSARIIANRAAFG